MLSFENAKIQFRFYWAMIKVKKRMPSHKKKTSSRFHENAKTFFAKLKGLFQSFLIHGFYLGGIILVQHATFDFQRIGQLTLSHAEWFRK